MEKTDFEHNKEAYVNYVKLFHPSIVWPNTIYKDLNNILDENFGLTTASLGDYFLVQFILVLNDNLILIENKIEAYTKENNFDKIQKEYIFYHKQFLEKRIDELFIEFNLKKKIVEKRKTIPAYDRILKDLKVIEIIFMSQMDPTIHLGSGIGLARYCNEIFIYSDVELLEIGKYKGEYTSRLEKSNNKLLLLNELADIYNSSIVLYNFFVDNLLNHPDKKEIFKGEDVGQQILDSTGYYNFINYRASFCFFGVEKNDIDSKFLQNNFSYRCKNETLVNFCVQLLEFIKLSGILFNENEESIKKNKNIQSENRNPFPLIFASDDDKNYLLFKKFVVSHIIDKFIDFSFIFQQMKYDGYILDVKHLKFMDWLRKNNYITEKDLEDFKEKNSFRSLSKCASGTRLNLYLKLKEEMISNSD